MLSSTAFRFLQRLSNFHQWLSDFFNGFLLSSTAFRFLQRLSNFPQRLSSFKKNLRESIYGGKYTKDHHSSFVFPATRSPSFIIATRSPCFVIATRSPSFAIATRSPSFVIATMRASHPTITSIKLLWLQSRERAAHNSNNISCSNVNNAI